MSETAAGALRARSKTKPGRATGHGRRRFTRKQKIVITVVNLAAFFAVWELLPVVLDLPPIFLPRLSDVLAEFPRMHEEGVLIENVLISLQVYVIGMVIAMVMSIPLGLLLGAVKILDRVISPYLWAIYTTPMLISMPLILLWVGFTNTARVLLVILSAVPAIVVVVMEGVKTVDHSLLQAARSFGAGRGRLFTHVIFPSTIPFIGTGVKMGVSRGLIGLFVGELFTSATGIGYIIELATKVFNIPRVFAMLAMFVVFSITMVGVAQYVEQKLSAWRPTSAL